MSQREPSFKPAIVFVGVCAMSATIVGLRWSLDVRGIRFIQPVIASSLPPIAWFCFSGLVGPGNTARLWTHAIPFGVISILSVTWPLWHPPIDMLLAVLFFGYGIALFRLGSGGPDGLAATRLSDAAKAHKATLIAGLVLIGSGAADLLIAGDFGFYKGAHAALIVGSANVIMLPLIAYAVAVVGKSVSAAEALQSAQDSPEGGETASASLEAPDVSTPDDARIVEAFDTKMREKQLFRDPDLTLSRLARKAGIPSRQISTAIRIEEAQRLLAQSDLPITTIIFEAGFQTKSNFNREFLRVTGMSPSDYRRSNARSSNENEPVSVG